jgi:uncharacterized protein
MMPRVRLWAALSIILSLLLSVCSGESQASPYDRLKDRPQLPGPMGYVSDHAQVLDESWKERIRSVCRDLERKTGVEMVVVTVPNLKPFTSAKDYVGTLYEKWNIGSTQQEHGIMVLVAVQERQAAITLGRQMYSIITPSIMGEIGGTYLHPAIELGHFGDGLYRTVVALASPAQDVRVGEPRKLRSRGVGFWLTVITAITGAVIFWWISRPDLRHPYQRIQRGEYWGTGQGGFGGNWGGFGGGTSGEGWR